MTQQVGDRPQWAAAGSIEPDTVADLLGVASARPSASARSLAQFPPGETAGITDTVVRVAVW
jgi:hypothetical protein